MLDDFTPTRPGLRLILLRPFLRLRRYFWLRKGWRNPDDCPW